MSKEITMLAVKADGLLIRSVKVGSYDHAEYTDRLLAARQEATLQLQRWHASDQFVGQRLTVAEVY